MIAFNIGKVAAGKTQSAVQVSMAASLKAGGGTTGLVVAMKKSEATTPPTSSIGKYNNGLCEGSLKSANKACSGSTLNSGGLSTLTEYLSVWNTGGCTKGSKLLIEASVEEFFAGQNSKCTNRLVEVGAPRSGGCNLSYNCVTTHRGLTRGLLL